MSGKEVERMGLHVHVCTDSECWERSSLPITVPVTPIEEMFAFLFIFYYYYKYIY